MSCGDPGKPLNFGYRTGNEFWAGNMVFYTCDPGYYLLGASNRLCLENGAWSNSIPSYSKGSYSRSVNSFLFSFVNKDNLKPFKMKVFQSQNAIYGGSSYGPIFGNSHDIYISNNAGSNTNSYTNLGNCYVLIKGYTYGSTKARNLLAGSYYFQPDEIEVFRQDGLEV
ncbi:Sushi, von Willebrand factor type A, EGF and pentraxin domain-containing protein 1 [Exaiptasia diaphana]|nr:Sushi, von Willebrand factor type A, EGF and pentraxin domain-containing protein 1 [Exaiptasia diaphana]